MKLVAGIAALDIPQRFAAARKRIILHAAVYGPFASSEPHSNGLAQALSRSTFECLDIIGFTPDNNEPWKADFYNALRFGAPPRTVEEEIADSYTYISGLAADHPDKIRLHPVRTLPNFPALIIDDTIIFGQYAQTTPHAPQGFWGIVKADVEKLLSWAEQGSMPTNASEEELAAFRVINECFRAMQPTTAS